MLAPKRIKFRKRQKGRNRGLATRGTELVFVPIPTKALVHSDTERRLRMIRKFTDKKLLVATHNQGKREEVADLVGHVGVKVVGAAELGLPEPEETGSTFVENARIKAVAAVNAVRECCSQCVPGPQCNPAIPADHSVSHQPC